MFRSMFITLVWIYAVKSTCFSPQSKDWGNIMSIRSLASTNFLTIDGFGNLKEFSVASNTPVSSRNLIASFNVETLNSAQFISDTSLVILIGTKTYIYDTATDGVTALDDIPLIHSPSQVKIRSAKGAGVSVVAFYENDLKALKSGFHILHYSKPAGTQYLTTEMPYEYYHDCTPVIPTVTDPDLARFYLDTRIYIGQFAYTLSTGALVPSTITLGTKNEQITSNLAYHDTENYMAFSIRVPASSASSPELSYLILLTKDLLTYYATYKHYLDIVGVTFVPGTTNEIIVYNFGGEIQSCTYSASIIYSWLSCVTTQYSAGDNQKMFWVSPTKLLLYIDASLILYNYNSASKVISLSQIYHAQPYYSEKSRGASFNYLIYPGLYVRKFDSETLLFSGNNIYSGAVQTLRIQPDDNNIVLVMTSQRYIKKIDVATQAVLVTFDPFNDFIETSTNNKAIMYSPRLKGFDFVPSSTTTIVLIYEGIEKTTYSFRYLASLTYNLNTKEGHLNAFPFSLADGLGGTVSTYSSVRSLVFLGSTSAPFLYMTGATGGYYILKFEVDQLVPYSSFFKKTETQKTIGTTRASAVRNRPNEGEASGSIGLLFRYQNENDHFFGINNLQVGGCADMADGKLLCGWDSALVIDDNNKISYAWYLGWSRGVVIQRSSDSGIFLVQGDDIMVSFNQETCYSGLLDEFSNAYSPEQPSNCKSPYIYATNDCFECENDYHVYTGTPITLSCIPNICPLLSYKLESLVSPCVLDCNALGLCIEGDRCKECPVDISPGTTLKCPNSGVMTEDYSCISSCDQPSRFFKHYGICVVTIRDEANSIYTDTDIYCSTSTYLDYSDKSTCLATCSELELNDPQLGRSCISRDECYNVGMFVDGGTCIESCPAQSVIDIGLVKECMLACPPTTKQIININGVTECYSQCQPSENLIKCYSLVTPALGKLTRSEKLDFINIEIEFAKTDLQTITDQIIEVRKVDQQIEETLQFRVQDEDVLNKGKIKIVLSYFEMLVDCIISIQLKQELMTISGDLYLSSLSELSITGDCLNWSIFIDENNEYSSCIICSAPNVIIGGECKECPSDTTYSDQREECVSCDPTCLTCLGSATSCTSCESIMYLEINTCKECHQSCLTCRGSSDLSCLTCDPTKDTRYYQEGACVSECSVGYKLAGTQCEIDIEVVPLDSILLNFNFIQDFEFILGNKYSDYDAAFSLNLIRKETGELYSDGPLTISEGIFEFTDMKDNKIKNRFEIIGGTYFAILSFENLSDADTEIKITLPEDLDLQSPKTDGETLKISNRTQALKVIIPAFKAADLASIKQAAKTGFEVGDGFYTGAETLALVSGLFSLDHSGNLIKLSRNCKLMSRLALLDLNYGSLLDPILLEAAAAFSKSSEDDRDSVERMENGKKGRISKAHISLEFFAKLNYKIILYLISWIFVLISCSISYFTNRSKNPSPYLAIFVYFQKKLHFSILNITLNDGVFMAARSLIHGNSIGSDAILSIIILVLMSIDLCLLFTKFSIINERKQFSGANKAKFRQLVELVCKSTDASAAQRRGSVRASIRQKRRESVSIRMPAKLALGIQRDARLSGVVPIDWISKEEAAKLGYNTEVDAEYVKELANYNEAAAKYKTASLDVKKEETIWGITGDNIEIIGLCRISVYQLVLVGLANIVIPSLSILIMCEILYISMMIKAYTKNLLKSKLYIAQRSIECISIFLFFIFSTFILVLSYLSPRAEISSGLQIAVLSSILFFFLIECCLAISALIYKLCKIVRKPKEERSIPATSCEFYKKKVSGVGSRIHNNKIEIKIADNKSKELQEVGYMISPPKQKKLDIPKMKDRRKIGGSGELPGKLEAPQSRHSFIHGIRRNSRVIDPVDVDDSFSPKKPRNSIFTKFRRKSRREESDNLQGEFGLMPPKQRGSLIPGLRRKSNTEAAHQFMDEWSPPKGRHSFIPELRKKSHIEEANKFKDESSPDRHRNSISPQNRRISMFKKGQNKVFVRQNRGDQRSTMLDK